ncbi:MAG: AbrB/MazE/SpoVT family DNA-binding domain-containing protein [Pseudomonadota bacterium]
MNYHRKPRQQAKLVSGGRLQIPAEVRRELGLNDGDTVVMELDGRALKITPYHTVITRMQERMAKYAPQDGTLVSDELIAERRAEAARE